LFIEHNDPVPGTERGIFLLTTDIVINSILSGKTGNSYGAKQQILIQVLSVSQILSMVYW
jgi:hypothetical protein